MSEENTSSAAHTGGDHGEIGALVSGFFRALDAREFAPGWADAYFTADARMETPVGTARGPEAVRVNEEGIRRFTRTQHTSSDLLVERGAGSEDLGEAGGTATASWNALMTHVHPSQALFTVGGVWRAELRRTADGWRFSSLALQVIWTTGEPPVLSGRTG
jgi:hypothetical protein